MSLRTYQDPLHGGISLDSRDPAEAMVMKLIDTQPFQRLRRLRQLGPAFLTFHGAESSRFTHSLGVFHLSRRAINKLIQFDAALTKQRGVLYGAALLHDLGHGPLSHTGEEMFGLNHEKWSAELVRKHPEVKQALEDFEIGTAESVASLLEGNLKTSSKAIKALVSSQLDCDRLDYLLRDSHSTGTRYGLLDLDRILSALTIAPDGDLAIHPKGLMAVEHYLVIRNLMYRSVYNHRLNEVCNWLLVQIIQMARILGPGKVWTDKIMAKWLWNQDNLDLNLFLGNDDIRMGYHLIRWQEDETQAALSELCKRFLTRNLLKALSIGNLSNTEQLEALALARKLSEEKSLNPDQCCGLRHQSLHGYHPYIGGLRLWDGEQLSAIEQASPLIESLSNPAGTSWLIHPKEINNELIKKLTDFRKSR
ncbi:HD domain-containing protein [Prochlorococcus sp. MIT 1300]|uniref:HD domain-containing protein n=1 Tax=Prochlorococcus sp. MIT 1300 TaxID=3096218 RepID=UPI002A74F366|nr:HD domain-containing protein [Prochlorococcus sp. MIT 1300]